MKKLACLVLLVLMAAGCACAQETPYTMLSDEEVYALLGERTLADEQLQSLQWMALDGVRAAVSTWGDYVGFVETLTSQYWADIYCGDAYEINVGDAWSYQWLSQMLGSNLLADVGRSVLEDNFPGTKTVIAVLCEGPQRYTVYATAIPVDGGYVVLGADTFARNIVAVDKDTPRQTVPPMLVNSLEALVEYFRTEPLLDPFCANAELAQIMIVSSCMQAELCIVEGMYTSNNPYAVKNLYQNAEATQPGENTAPTLQGYGIPLVQTDVRINNYADASGIRKGSLEDAAEVIASVQDVMNYVYYSGYVCGDGDMAIAVRDGLQWHYNYKPEAVFARHTGCCGATSGLVAHLLDGDYDEVGFIGITYAEGCGGGHVINYIRTGGMYYVFDVFAWGIAGYSQDMLRCCWSTSLRDAANQWAERTGNVITMYAYTNDRGGDAPVGWKDGQWGVSYLIKDYAQNVEILKQWYEKGEYYLFVDVDPRLVEGIDLIRSVW